MAESRRKKRTLLFPILPLLFSAFLPVVAHASVEGEADDQKSELVSSNLSTNEKEGQEHSDSESQTKERTATPPLQARLQLQLFIIKHTNLSAAPQIRLCLQKS